MDVGQALAAARALGLERLDAQWLLCHHLQRNRAWLLAHEDHVLPPDVAAVLAEQMARRAAGEPLAYVVGEREFCGLRLKVGPAVLIPRPETELLVEWALELLPSAPSAELVDLGTGSGAIAIALAARRSGLAVTATDASEAALAVARGNARRLGLKLDFARGTWWEPLAGRRFGLALANPPYIAEGDPHLAALVHEPASALTASGQGLDDLRSIIVGAAGHLLPGAWLLLEHGHDQGPAIRTMLERTGFEQVLTKTDLAGLERCSGGRRPMLVAELTQEAHG